MGKWVIRAGREPTENSKELAEHDTFQEALEDAFSRYYWMEDYGGIYFEFRAAAGSGEKRIPFTIETIVDAVHRKGCSMEGSLTDLDDYLTGDSD